MTGAQCVMTSGVLLMLKWPADSWDSPPLVGVIYTLHAKLFTIMLFDQIRSRFMIHVGVKHDLICGMSLHAKHVIQRT